jgi:carnosine synthase
MNYCKLFDDCWGNEASGHLVGAGVPKELLERGDSEGQILRISLLRGSCIIFVCAGYPGKRFIYEFAARCGIRSVLIDSYDSWAKILLKERVIDHFIGVDMTAPPDALFQEALWRIRETGIKPDGVCTFVELSVSVSARLARALGCPGPDISSVTAARDKFKTREAMVKAGLPHVRNTMITSETDLRRSAELIGFPAVLKPISGAASLGVRKVRSASEFVEVYRNVLSTISELVVASGALERGTETHAGVKASCVIDVSVMMEEYIEGPEFDVDLIMSDGKCRYCDVVDNGPTFEPFFAETWAAIPSSQNASVLSEIKNLAIQSVEALGFLDGVFHVELKYTSSGPRLIEVNARMGGGPTRKIHQLVNGVDLVLEQFFIAVGLPSRPIVAPAPQTCVAYAFINSRSSGVACDVSFMQAYASRPHIVWIHVYVKTNERVVGSDEGHPTWLGDIVVAHPDAQEALKIAKSTEEEIANEFMSRLIQNTTVT